MNTFVGASLAILLIWAGLALLVKRNLRQRERARQLRAIFIALANDLVGKPEFPDRHARQLVEFSVVPGGWLTRYMVFVLVRKIMTGAGPAHEPDVPSFDQVPARLQAKYVTALLALALSDSYRCALLGRIWRGTYGWVNDAILEVKPDVQAHATRRVVDQIAHVHAPRQLQAANRRIECVA